MLDIAQKTNNNMNNCHYKDDDGYIYLRCRYDYETGLCVKCGHKLGTPRLIDQDTPISLIVEDITVIRKRKLKNSKIKCRMCHKEKIARAFCKNYFTECRMCIKQKIWYYQLILKEKQ